MQTYWDLTEKERAALTYEAVERFVDAELMLRGVLAVPELEFVPVPEAPAASVTIYRPRSNTRYALIDVAFVNEEQARAFLDLQPVIVGKDWELGDAQIATPFTDATIEAVQCISRETADVYKSQLQSIKAAKDENDRRKRARDEQQKKVDAALKGLWEDWHACCAKARAIAAINVTREKYLKLAGGDEETAARFLAMVHSEAELAEAAAWGGNKPAAAVAPPKPQQPAEEIPF